MPAASSSAISMPPLPPSRKPTAPKSPVRIARSSPVFITFIATAPPCALDKSNLISMQNMVRPLATWQGAAQNSRIVGLLTAGGRMMNRRELLAGGACVARRHWRRRRHMRRVRIRSLHRAVAARALAAGVRGRFSTPRPLISVLTMALSLRRRGKANSAGHFWDYVEGAVSPARIRLGRKAVKRSAAGLRLAGDEPLC